jgi:hypothetical protein
MLLLLPFMASMSKDPLPRHIPGLESNDVLYSGDPTYLEDLINFQRTILEALVGAITDMESAVTNGETKVKGLLMELLPELLAQTHNVISIDRGTTPAFEKVAASLKTLGELTYCVLYIPLCVLSCMGRCSCVCTYCSTGASRC